MTTAAKTAWKHDHPNDSLKRHKKLYDQGRITQLPWENYLPNTTISDNKAAIEAAKWAQEQLNERPGDYVNNETYMKNVAILYIGNPRFKDLSTLNHKKLIDDISLEFKVVIYDFTQPILDRSECPFISSGAIQLWDFYTSVDKIEEDIIIKIRTDLFFTDSSIKTIISELKQIVNNQIDVSFLGLGLLSEHVDSGIYKEEYYSYTYRKSGKVLDWIVIVDKKFILTKDVVFEDLTTGKSSRNVSGNYTWKLIVKPPAKSNVVSCHTALIRKSYKNEDFIFKNVVLDMFKLSLPQSLSVVTFFKENLCS